MEYILPKLLLSWAASALAIRSFNKNRRDYTGGFYVPKERRMSNNPPVHPTQQTKNKQQTTINSPPVHLHQAFL